MTELEIEVIRQMVILNHNAWGVLIGLALGCTEMMVATFIRNNTCRVILYTVSVVVLTFTIVTKTTIEPFENTLHQQGTCLLAVIDQK